MLEVGDDAGFATWTSQCGPTAGRGDREQAWVESPMRPWFPVGAGPGAIRRHAVSSSCRPGVTRTTTSATTSSCSKVPAWTRSAWWPAPTAKRSATSTTPYGEFQLPAEPAEIEVTLDAARDAPWWSHSTRTSTTWRFVSEPSKGEPVTQPLYQVDYDIVLDLQNETDSAEPNRVPGVRDRTAAHLRVHGMVVDRRRRVVGAACPHGSW